VEEDMAKTVKDLLAEANTTVPKLSPAEAAEKIRSGDVMVVDVRDPHEVQQSGKIKGAVNVSRGMLEFRADPESQFHDPAFQKDKTVLLHCGSGGRAALAGKTLQDMGYTAVFNIGGTTETCGSSRVTSNSSEPSLRFLQKAMFGSARCLAKFPAVMRNG
jgi:rhodanese-related sulfurtransferase